MSVQNHISVLKDKHNGLDEALDKETARPQPDEERIHELKKQKLQIKDELSRLDPSDVA